MMMRIRYGMYAVYLKVSMNSPSVPGMTALRLKIIAAISAVAMRRNNVCILCHIVKIKNFKNSVQK